MAARPVASRVTRLRDTLLLGPSILWLILFFFLPLVLIIAMSFFAYRDAVIVRTFTLENYQKLLTDTFNLRIFLRSLGLAASVGITTVILAFPVAHFLVRSRSKWRGVALALVLLPLLASVVVRTYGWLVLLGDHGFVNEVLGLMGIGPFKMMHSYKTIFVGLVHVLLPYSVLSIMASLHSIPPSLERASTNLGAGRLQTFRYVTLPLAWPGMLTGFVLTFSLALTAYATPRILGGTTSPVTATQIYDYMLFLLNWPFAAAMAVAVLIITIIMLYLLTLVQRSRD